MAASSGLPNASLNAKALHARKQLALKQLRDENGKFSSSLFLVQTTNAIPRFEVLNESLLRECELLVEKMPKTPWSEIEITNRGKKKQVSLFSTCLQVWFFLLFLFLCAHVLFVAAPGCELEENFQVIPDPMCAVRTHGRKAHPWTD